MAVDPYVLNYIRGQLISDGHIDVIIQPGGTVATTSGQAWHIDTGGTVPWLSALITAEETRLTTKEPIIARLVKHQDMSVRKANVIVARRTVVTLALNQILQQTSSKVWPTEHEFYIKLCADELYTAEGRPGDNWSYKTLQRDIMVIEKYAADLVVQPLWFKYRKRQKK